MSAKSTLALATLATSSVVLSGCLTQETQEGPAVETQPVQPGVQEEAILEQPELVQEVVVETTYETPAGEEPVVFTVVVDTQGVIVDAQTEVLAKAPISIVRQESFSEALPEQIMGKKLSELTSVDRVGGSSLTTGAFNAALADMKAQL